MEATGDAYEMWIYFTLEQCETQPHFSGRCELLAQPHGLADPLHRGNRDGSGALGAIPKDSVDG